MIAMGVLYFCFKSLRYALDSRAPCCSKSRLTSWIRRLPDTSAAFDWVGFLGVIAGGYLSDGAQPPYTRDFLDDGGNLYRHGNALRLW